MNPIFMPTQLESLADLAVYLDLTDQIDWCNLKTPPLETHREKLKREWTDVLVNDEEDWSEEDVDLLSDIYALCGKSEKRRKTAKN